MKSSTSFYSLICRTRYLWAAVLSFASCVGVNLLFFGGVFRIFSNSIFCLMLFIALIPVFARMIGGRAVHENVFSPVTRRNLACSAGAGLIFSICMAFGRDISLVGSIDYSNPDVYLTVLLMWPLFTAFMSLLLSWLGGFPQGTSPLAAKNTRYAPDYKLFLILWLIIFICWIPVFLASYPGVYRYDAPYQTDYVVFNGRIWGHHPVLHTIYLMATLTLGNSLFGSYESGMAIYSVTQMLVLSAIYAYACYYLARKRAPLTLQVLAAAYFALVPFHAVMAVTATKDTIFSGFFLLCVLFTADLADDPKRFTASKFEMIRYAFVLLSMCVWRNNGIYILIVFLPIVIIALRQYWKNLLILSAAVLVLYAAYSGPMMSLLDVVPGNSREALSVPMQQMARAALYAEDELTEEELDNIHDLISEDYVQQYNARISDPVKNGFKTSVLFREPLKYLKTYFSVGLKCPDVYLDAFLNLSLGNWYPDMIYPDAATGHQYIEYEDWTQAYENTRRSDQQIIPARESKLPALDDWLTTYTLDVTQQDIPVLSMLVSSGFMFFLIVATCAVILYFKRYARLLTPLMLLGLWGTVMLGPIALFRYSYPLMVCTPFLLYYIWSCRPGQAPGAQAEKARV